MLISAGVMPLSAPGLPYPASVRTIGSRIAGMRLGAHRGFGKTNGTKCGGFVENTMESFLAAARSRWVDFVELDVQVSIDGVPVVWHDDLLTASRRVCDVLAQDFLTIPVGQLHRLGGLQDFQLCTLADVVSELPGHCGLDVELKPGLDSDGIRAVMQAVGTRAGVFFSSFDLGICTEIARMRAHDVWLLSEASVRDAVQQADRHSLAGAIVPFTRDLTGYHGLPTHRMMTYGDANNDIRSITSQAAAGFSGAIVDLCDLFTVE